MWMPLDLDNLSSAGVANIIKINVDLHFSNINAQSVLSIDELKKADRFVRLIDKKRFIVRKYFLRIILAKLLDIPVNKIEYHYLSNNKPAVNGINFNLSHSSNYVLIATCPTQIGIDIEYLDPNIEFQKIIDEYFSEKETSFILNSKDQVLSFFTLWTRKEALLKATGEGLVDRLDLVAAMSDFVLRNNQEFNISSMETIDNYLISIAVDSKQHKQSLWEM